MSLKENDKSLRSGSFIYFFKIFCSEVTQYKYKILSNLLAFIHGSLNTLKLINNFL